MGESAKGPLTERIEAAVEEHERRARAGEVIDLDAFCAGYADIAPHLRRELEMHAVLGQLTTRPVLEQIGAELGDYRLVEEIGRGGMGVVFRARDETLGRDVAVKVVAIDPLRPERAERLLREARAIARIRHPHVVEVYAFGRTDRWLYLVMELLDGTLADRMAAPAGDRLAQVRQWITEAAEGIAHCHAQGIVHRDLKLENLLVDGHGAVKVADFGLARADDLVRVTETGHVLGTLGYAAPELLRGESADVRTDVYGLGACLYALLVGRSPGRDATPWRSLPPGTPPALRTAIAGAMAPERADRLADAHAFIQVVAGEGTALHRRRVLAAALLGGGMLAIAGGIIWSKSEPATGRGAAVPAAAAPEDALPLAGGFIIAEYERWLRENEPPPAEVRAPGASFVPTFAIWEQKLAELSTGREISRARSVEFEHDGRTYVASATAAEDHVEVALESEGALRARVRLGPEALAGHTDGWGIYFETTDEDGDGRKELVLVRVGDELASIRIIKWDPQAWLGDDVGWRRPAPPDSRYGQPTINGARLESLHRGGGEVELASFDLGTGARAAPSRPGPALRPLAPRLLGADTDLWLEVGHAGALVIPAAAATWRWPPSGPSPVTWRATHIGNEWLAVGVGGELALAGLQPGAVMPAVEEEHPRHLLGAAPAAVAWGDRRAVCAAAVDAVACVSPPTAGNGTKILWQVRLPPGQHVTQPPVDIGDIDGDGHAELAVASELGRLYVVSARDGGSILAERDLEAAPGQPLRPVAPLLWLDAPGCVAVVGTNAITCASVAAGRIETRTISAMAVAEDHFTSARQVQSPTGTLLLLVTIEFGRKRGVQVIDPAAAPGTDPVLWHYALPTDPLPAVAAEVRDGRLWIAFADLSGALYALPVPLPTD